MRAGLAAVAGVLAAALPAAASPASARPAAAGGSAQAASSAQGAASAAVRAPLTLTVTSLSPAYAEQGQTITITGRVDNASAVADTGLSIGLLSSTMSLGSRLSVLDFAHGTYLPAESQLAVAPLARSRLSAGTSWAFTIRLPVRALGLSCFGVYPLTVQVTDGALQYARDQVPLPFWPARSGGCAGQRRPQPFPISWVWPLVDSPHQGACAGLIDNKLAGSVAPAGRLGYLLAVGGRYARQAGLTWAIDPALLDSVRIMTKPYPVGTSSTCGGEAGDRPASHAARRWLAALLHTTAGEPLFVTSYADVDMAALVHSGDNTDLDRSLTAADQVAREILHRSLVPANGKAGSQLSAMAWPPGGLASEALLDLLAGSAGVSTVILTAPPAAPVSYTPGAVTSKLTGVAKYVHILLSDHEITRLLGSRAAASRASGAIFAVSQLYLAQTAMISAEQPGNVRPILVAPPRRWDPPRRLASALLAETAQAPWLRPVPAGQLATMRPQHLYPSLTSSAASGEVSPALLAKIARLDARIALLQSVRVTPDPDLSRAVFAIESSAWRGKESKHAKALLARTSRYVQTQLEGLSIRGSSSKHSILHVTFGGKSSTVNVAILNNLGYSVQLRLKVQQSRASVSGVPRLIKIPPFSSTPVKLTVHTVKNQQGRIRLSLTAPDGKPLPAYPLVMVVHATDLGIIALVICAVALALFVIASAVRSIRTGRPGPAGDAAPPGGLVADQEALADGTGLTDGKGLADGTGLAASTGPPEKIGAGFGSLGLVDLGNRPEHKDSVGRDDSELTSAGPPADDQEPAAPGRRATEERR